GADGTVASLEGCVKPTNPATREAGGISHTLRPSRGSRSLEEREQPAEFGFRRLRAVLADLERLGILDGLGPVRAAQVGEALADPVRDAAVALLGPVAGPFEPLGLPLGDLAEVAEEPGVPLVELRLEGVDRGDLLVEHRVERHDDVRRERVRLLE